MARNLKSLTSQVVQGAKNLGQQVKQNAVNQTTASGLKSKSGQTKSTGSTATTNKTNGLSGKATRAQNLRSTVDKWASGETKVTARDLLAQIGELGDLNYEDGQRAFDLYNQAVSDRSSPVWNPYANATNTAAIEALSALGVDMSDGVTKERIDSLKQYADYTGHVGVSGAPLAPTKTSTDAQNLAYWLYQLDKDEVTTQKAESEWSSLQDYIKEQVKLGASDDEIVNGIQWGQYSTLKGMDDDKSLGVPTQLNRAIGYSEDAIYGTIWAARNPEYATEDSMINAAYYSLGYGSMLKTTADKPKTGTVEAEIAAEDDVTNYAKYNPYKTTGGTFGEYTADWGLKDGEAFTEQDIINHRAELLALDNGSTVISNMLTAVDNTAKAKEELEDLNKQIKRWQDRGMSADEVWQRVEEAFDNGEYSMLSKLEDGRIKGKPVNTAGGFTFTLPSLKREVYGHDSGGVAMTTSDAMNQMLKASPVESAMPSDDTEEDGAHASEPTKTGNSLDIKTKKPQKVTVPDGASTSDTMQSILDGSVEKSNVEIPKGDTTELTSANTKTGEKKQFKSAFTREVNNLIEGKSTESKAAQAWYDKYGMSLLGGEALYAKRTSRRTASAASKDTRSTETLGTDAYNALEVDRLGEKNGYVSTEDRISHAYEISQDMEAAEAVGLSLGDYYKAHPDLLEKFDVWREAADASRTAMENEAAEQQRIQQEETKAQIMDLYNQENAGLELSVDLLFSSEDQDSWTNTLNQLYLHNAVMDQNTGAIRENDEYYANLWNEIHDKALEAVKTSDKENDYYIGVSGVALAVANGAADALDRDAKYASAMGMTLEEFYDANPDAAKDPDELVKQTIEEFNQTWAGGDGEEAAYELLSYYNTNEGIIDLSTGSNEVDLSNVPEGEVTMLTALGKGVQNGYWQWVNGHLEPVATYGEALRTMISETNHNGDSNEYIAVIARSASRSDYRASVEESINNLSDENEKVYWTNRLNSWEGDIYNFGYEISQQELEDNINRRNQAIQDNANFIEKNGSEAEKLTFSTTASFTNNALLMAENTAINAVTGLGSAAAALAGKAANATNIFAKGMYKVLSAAVGSIPTAITYGLPEGAELAGELEQNYGVDKVAAAWWGIAQGYITGVFENVVGIDKILGRSENPAMQTFASFFDEDSLHTLGVAGLIKNLAKNGLSDTLGLLGKQALASYGSEGFQEASEYIEGNAMKALAASVSGGKSFSEVWNENFSGEDLWTNFNEGGLMGILLGLASADVGLLTGATQVYDTQAHADAQKAAEILLRADSTNLSQEEALALLDIIANDMKVNPTLIQDAADEYNRATIVVDEISNGALSGIDEKFKADLEAAQETQRQAEEAEKAATEEFQKASDQQLAAENKLKGASGNKHKAKIAQTQLKTATELLQKAKEKLADAQNATKEAKNATEVLSAQKQMERMTAFEQLRQHSASLVAQINAEKKANREEKAKQEAERNQAAQNAENHPESQIAQTQAELAAAEQEVEAAEKEVAAQEKLGIAEEEATEEAAEEASTEEAPKAEETATEEAPKAEEASTEEAPKTATEEAPKAEEASTEEAPKTETEEAPKAEEASTEEAPKTETEEAPKAEEASTEEAPKTETEAIEAAPDEVVPPPEEAPPVTEEQAAEEAPKAKRKRKSSKGKLKAAQERLAQAQKNAEGLNKALDEVARIAESDPDAAAATLDAYTADGTLSESDAQALAKQHNIQATFSDSKRTGVTLQIAPSKRQQLTSIQNTQLKMLDELAKDYGLNVIVRDDLSFNGARIHGTNRIYVNLNATGDGIVQAGVHEMTHFIAEFNKDGYSDLVRFVTDELSDTGVDLDKAIDDRIAEYAESGRKLTRDKALEEIVSETVPSVFTSEDVLHRFAYQHPEAIKSIRNFFLDFWQKLRDIARNILNITTESGHGHDEVFALVGQNQTLQAMYDAFIEAADEAYEEYKKYAPKEDTGLELNEADLSTSTLKEWEDSLREHLRVMGADSARADEIVESLRGEVKKLSELKAKGEIGRRILTYIYRGPNITDGALRDKISPIRSNVEYVWTFDLDANCPKRLRYSNIVDVIEAKEHRKLTEIERRNLLTIMAWADEETPCTYCYVEGKRILKADAYQDYLRKRNRLINEGAGNKDRVQRLIKDNFKSKTSKSERTANNALLYATGKNAYNPDVEQLFTDLAALERTVYDFLDEHYKPIYEAYKTSEGMDLYKFTRDDSLNKMVKAMVEAFNIELVPKKRKIPGTKNDYETIMAPQTATEAELKNMACDWLFDVYHQTEHKYMDANIAAAGKIDERVLAVHHYASNYASSVSQARSEDQYAPYTNQVYSVSQRDKQVMNAHGGFRIHSSNDFRPDYIVDYMQFFADLEADVRPDFIGGDPVGWFAHAYTKSPDFVKIFAPTNTRINMSIAMVTDPKTGEIHPNIKEGMDWAEAKALRKDYDNAGTMAMVTDTKQLSFALNSPWIDMIIPFHASGQKEIYYKLKGWFDFSATQNEKSVSEAKTYLRDALKREGVEVPKNRTAEEVYAENHPDFRKAYRDHGVPDGEVFYTLKSAEAIEYVRTHPGKRYSKDGKYPKPVKYTPHFLPGKMDLVRVDPKTGVYMETITIEGHNNDKDTYLRLCREYGVTPRFYNLTIQDADGRDMSILDHPQYMKVIKETARTDTEQKYVTAKFNSEYALDSIQGFVDKQERDLNIEQGARATSDGDPVAKSSARLFLDHALGQKKLLVTQDQMDRMRWAATMKAKNVKEIQEAHAKLNEDYQVAPKELLDLKAAVHDNVLSKRQMAAERAGAYETDEATSDAKMEQFRSEERAKGVLYGAEGSSSYNLRNENFDASLMPKVRRTSSTPLQSREKTFTQLFADLGIEYTKGHGGFAARSDRKTYGNPTTGTVHSTAIQNVGQLSDQLSRQLNYKLKLDNMDGLDAFSEKLSNLDATFAAMNPGEKLEGSVASLVYTYLVNPTGLKALAGEDLFNEFESRLKGRGFLAAMQTAQQALIRYNNASESERSTSMVDMDVVKPPKKKTGLGRLLETKIADKTYAVQRVTDLLIEQLGEEAVNPTRDPRALMLANSNKGQNFVDACIEDHLVTPQGGVIDTRSLGSILQQVGKNREDQHEFNAYWLCLHKLDRMNANQRWVADPTHVPEAVNIMSEIEAITTLEDGEPRENFTPAQAAKLSRLSQRYDEVLEQAWKDAIALDAKHRVSDESKEDVEAAIAQYEEAHPEWPRIVKEATDWYDKFMQSWVVDTHMITEDEYNQMHTMYPHYVPTYRTLYQNAQNHRNSIGTSGADNGLKGVTGSDLDVFNPVMGLAENVQNLIANYKSAEVGRALVQAIRGTTDNGFIAEIVGLPEDARLSKPYEDSEAYWNGSILSEPTLACLGRDGVTMSVDKNGRNIMTVLDGDGKQTSLQINDPLLADVLLHSQPQDMGRVFNAARRVKALITNTATALSLGFSVPNAMSDLGTAFMTGSFATNPVSAVLKWLRAASDYTVNHAKDSLGMDTSSTYDAYKLFGSLNSRYNFREHNAQVELQTKLYGGSVTFAEVRDAFERSPILGVGSALTVLPKLLIRNPIEWINDNIENATRYTEFKYGKHRLNNYAGKLEAGRASREVTTDFNRSGMSKSLAFVKSWVPFSGAAIAGVNKSIMLLTKENRGRRRAILTKAGEVAAIGMMMAMARASFWSDDDKEFYSLLQDDYKMKYYIIPLDGNGHFLRIKKSQDAVYLLADQMGEFLANYLTKSDGGEFGDLLGGAENLLASMTDFTTVFDPLIDVTSNTTWYGTPIESYRMEQLPVGERYDNDTSSVWRGISNAVNAFGVEWSPLDCEYLARQYLGSYGTILGKALQQASTGDLTAASFGKIISDRLTGRLTIDGATSNQASNIFYDGYDVVSSIASINSTDGKSSYLRYDLTEDDFNDAISDAKHLKKMLDNTKDDINALWDDYDATDDEDAQREIRIEIMRVACEANAEISEFTAAYCYSNSWEQAVMNTLDLITNKKHSTKDD